MARLPLAALRLPPDAVEGLSRLGLRRVEEVMDLPRAALARRFGAHTLRRVDQALGLEPEPVAPARAPCTSPPASPCPSRSAKALTSSPGSTGCCPLYDRLNKAGRGARRVRLQCFRSDGQVSRAEVGLARPANQPDRIRPHCC